MVKVFYSDISQLQNDDISDFCLERKEYIQSITCSKRKLQSIFVWKLLLKVLKEQKIDFSGFSFVNEKWGLTESDYNFSLSHSENLVVVALSDNNVGVDVELYTEKLLKVSKRIFPTQKIPKNKAELTFFAELWAKRECDIKSNFDYKRFFSYTISDNCGNQYVLGVCGDDKPSLKKIVLG